MCRHIDYRLLSAIKTSNQIADVILLYVFSGCELHTVSAEEISVGVSVVVSVGHWF